MKSESSTCLLIISHPRSGTHFTIDSLSQNIENAVFMPLHFGTSPGPDQLLLSHDPHFAERLRQYMFSQPGKVPLLKSHLLPEEFERAAYSNIIPDESREIIEYIYSCVAKIYIRRDCRDVMTSYYNYVQKGGGLLHVGGKARYHNVTFSEFIRMPNDYVMPVRSYQEYDTSRIKYWHHHVSTWMSVPHVTHITYEDLINDWKATFKKLIKRTGLRLTLASNLRQPAIEKRSIINRLWKKPVHTIGFASPSQSTAKLPFRATIGSWRQFFSKTDMDFLCREIGDHSAPLGYTFLEGL